MPRKPTKASGKQTRRPAARAVSEEGVFRSDKYAWCPPGFFALKFTDIAARVAIQTYANLIGRRDPALAERLTEAVEAAGGWSDSELDAATAPEEEPDVKQG
jgi:hypothetical protein